MPDLVPSRVQFTLQPDVVRHLVAFEQIVYASIIAWLAAHGDLIDQSQTRIELISDESTSITPFHYVEVTIHFTTPKSPIALIAFGCNPNGADVALRQAGNQVSVASIRSTRADDVAIAVTRLLDEVISGLYAIQVTFKGEVPCKWVAFRAEKPIASAAVFRLFGKRTIETFRVAAQGD